MKNMEAQTFIACTGLISAGCVAYSGHDGWGLILLVTLLIVG